MSSEALAELVQRMRKAIEDMERIQRELSHPTADPRTGLAMPQAPLETVNQLKCCVDQFRLFLWAYVDGRNLEQSVEARESDCQ